MAKLILPPTEIAQRAAAELAREQSGNVARIHAINKAAYYLSIGNTDVAPGFDGFLITSATRAGLVHRVSTVDGCSCEAGQHGRACWHAATVEILEQAGRYTMPALPKARPTYAEALAAMDELFA